MTSEAETDLIARAVAGEEPALERLLLAHADRLRAHIGRKLPAALRSVVAEDDIIQETFIDAFRRIGLFQPHGDSAFYNWLVVIADHRLQDAIKAQQADKRGGGRAREELRGDRWGESVDELIELLAGPAHTPSQSAARHEAVSAVQVGLASLKEDYRRAIQLRHVRRLSVAEAARVMGKTPDAVRNLCRRGLEELRTVLGRSSQYLTRR